MTLNIPKWYSYEKYSATKDKDFGAKEWYQQIYIRVYCDSILRNWLHQKTTDQDLPPLNIFDEIRSNPIVDIESSQKLIDQYMDGSLHELYNKQTLIPGVHSITKHELDILSYLNKAKSNDDKYSEAATNQMVGAVLSVDLTLPNTLLIKSFTRLLNNLRKVEGNEIDRKKTISYLGWANNGLLQIIDLHHFEMEHYAKIKTSEFNIAVAPHGEVGDSAIDKIRTITLPKLFGEHSTFGNFSPNDSPGTRNLTTPLLNELLAVASEEANHSL